MTVLTLAGDPFRLCSWQKKPDRKPNVLFIAVDDLNDWLGCMGGHPNAKIPNRYRLAAQEVLFTNAHCQALLCGHIRVSLMTGLQAIYQRNLRDDR